MSHYMVPTRGALIAALTEQRKRLERWVAARTPEEMGQPITPSEAEGGKMWRPKDHLAHAVEVEAYLQGVVQRTLAGVDDPTGFYTQVGALEREEIKQAINEASERALEEYREEPVEGLLELLGETRLATMELLESLSDEQLDQVSPHSPFGQGTVRDLFHEMAWHEGQHVDWLTEAQAQA